MRISDSRLGRFLSVDPLTKKYPELSTYQYAGNTPIWATDLDGAEPNPTTGSIQSSATFNNSSPNQISNDQFQTIQTMVLQRINGTINTGGYQYNNGTARVAVSNNTTNSTGSNTPITSGARTLSTPLNFQINIIAGSGISDANYSSGTMNLFIGDPASPNVAASPHEYMHLLGLDDRYHSIYRMAGPPEDYLRAFPGRKETASMLLTSQIDPNYLPNSNMMSSPNANGGGQLTQNQLGFVFSAQQEFRQKASIYTSATNYTNAKNEASGLYFNGQWNTLQNQNGTTTILTQPNVRHIGTYYEFTRSGVMNISQYSNGVAQRLWDITPAKRFNTTKTPNRKIITDNH